jgi:Nucleolar protein,Nop52
MAKGYNEGNEPAVAVSRKAKKDMTKRQRRKQPNDKHKWPQHPKIQSMDARHKAYVRTAGLGTSSNTERKKAANLIDPNLDLMAPEVKFGRLLGGADQRTRHAAVAKLKAYLTARCDINNKNGGISEMDLLKLWKGLWFTLYMADKVPVQDELSKRLAELIWCVAGTEEEDEFAGQTYMDLSEEVMAGFEDEYDKYDEEEERGNDDDDEDTDEEVVMKEIFNSLEDDPEEESDGSGDDEEKDIEEEDDEEDDEDEPEMDDADFPHYRGAHLASLFIKTFLHTVRREWGKMDKYRVDKFYTLIRLYIHEVYLYMARRHWNIGIIRLFNDTIFDEVLNKVPNGLRYHLIDLSLEELAKVNAKSPMPLTEATFLDVMEPYFAMAQTGAGGDTSVQERVMEKVLGKFLDQFSVVSDQAVQEENLKATGEKLEATSLIFDQVHVGTVSQMIFSLASDAETPERYRKSLYDMHKAYGRKLKQVGKDVELPGLGEDEEADDQGQDQEGSNDELDIVQEAKKSKGEEKMAPEPKESKKRSRSSKDETPQDDATPSKTSAKKKSKPDGSDSPSEEVKSLPDKDSVSTTKRNRKNKKKKSAYVKDGDDDGVDEVVTISLAEQKSARVEENKKKRTQEKIKEDVKGVNGGETTKTKGPEKGRRVQFKPVNRSKSHKASMKALITATPPKTAVTTPEKGILLNKGGRRRTRSSTPSKVLEDYYFYYNNYEE